MIQSAYGERNNLVLNRSKVLGENGLEDQATGVTITPNPGFSLKTKRRDKETKVFINICVHDDIDEPSIKKRLDSNGEPVEGINIPLSVGAPRLGADKAGKDCLIYDIIMNPKVLKDAEEDTTGKYRDFVCQLCIQSVEQKYSELLDKRYKLPKLTYMGKKVESQTVKDRKKSPKIEEISETIIRENKNKQIAVKATNNTDVITELDMTYIVRWRGHHDEKDDTIECNKEYRDPILVPSDVQKYIECTCLISDERCSLDLRSICIDISPFRIQIKVPHYRALVLYFPCAIIAPSAKCSLVPKEGYLRIFELMLSVEVDRASWTENADWGSKAWLLSLALRRGGDTVNIGGDTADGATATTGNPYIMDGSDNIGTSKTLTICNTADGDMTLPEERFHIRLPRNVDQYTGLPMAHNGNESRSGSGEAAEANFFTVNGDGEEFPEDRFHKKDASSSYIISQREQAIKDKWDKYEREKEERKNDPNIEYVDMDDFRKGGKYAPPPRNDPESSAQQTEKDEAKERFPDAIGGSTASTEVPTVLQQASEVVAQLANKELTPGVSLSTTIWTELID